MEKAAAVRNAVVILYIVSIAQKCNLLCPNDSAFRCSEDVLGLRTASFSRVAEELTAQRGRLDLRQQA